jgi:hypothetical protein
VRQEGRRGKAGTDGEDDEERAHGHPTLTTSSRLAPLPIAAAILQPLDVIKTTQQRLRMSVGAAGVGAGGGSTSPNPSPPSTSAHSAPTRPRGVFGTAAGIAAEEGALALWKGLAPTIVRVFFGAGIYFVSLHSIADALGVGDGGGGGSGTAGHHAGASDSRGASSPSDAASARPSFAGVRSFVAGVAARSVAAALMSPVAVVKTRIESTSRRDRAAAPPYRGTAHAVLSIARTEGAASLYSGLLPTIARDAPFSGLYYAAYSRFKEVAATDAAQALLPMPAARNFLAGVTAGALATVLTHPADVLKTRLQLKVRGWGERGGWEGGRGKRERGRQA